MKVAILILFVSFIVCLNFELIIFRLEDIFLDVSSLSIVYFDLIIT